MTEQQEAERLASESVTRFGFVVVGYVPGTGKGHIGEQVSVLWRDHEMPQPFTVIRRASDEEWVQQQNLFRELFKREPFLEAGEPMVLMTD